MENKNEQQVPEIMPEPIEEPKKSKKGQMAKGVACGIAGTILVGFVALNVVTKITGTKIYITNATEMCIRDSAGCDHFNHSISGTGTFSCGTPRQDQCQFMVWNRRI